VILVVGVSHRTAPLEVREALAFPHEHLPQALESLKREAGLSEACILSTCNRVEIYGREAEPRAIEAVPQFLASYHGRPLEQLRPHLYVLEGEKAIRHVFRVAASLDSMVLGEPQILGQVKDAYEAAEHAGSLGATLNALRNRSVSAAKRARSETGIGQNAVSVSYVAVELARKIFGELRGKNVLMVGAGKMSELAAKHLVTSGARATVVGGRTFAKAEELAAALGGTAAPFESLREELGRADIVISSTGAPHTVIHREDVEQARKARGGRPLFLIDIAVPRDIDADVAKMDGVFLYDLDDLKAVSEANLRERQKEAAAAESLVEGEIREFLAWQKSLDVVPLLVELRKKAEEIRKAELEKVRGRLGSLSPEQQQAVEAATSAIVNKLLHPPTVQIKELSKNGYSAETASLVRRLFGL